MRSALQKSRFGYIPAGLTRLILDTQKEGLTGHIETVFPDLGENSAWLGGNGEAWERGPYYLDGLAPLAYLTKDETLLQKTKKWFNAILYSQREDGFFGSPRSLDYWPRMVVLKAFVTIHRKTNDERIIPFFLRYFDYVYKNIEKRPFEMWAVARSLESFAAIQYTYECTKEKWLLDLLEKHVQNGFDFTDYFTNLPIKKKTSFYIPRFVIMPIKGIFNLMADRARLNLQDEKPKTKKVIERFNNLRFVKNYLKSHGVNIAMMMKYPFYTDCLHNTNDGMRSYEKGYEDLLALHGTALQIHSTDEHLSGTSPCQGVELCAVVEAMYSYEEIFRLTQDARYAEKCQFLAYNVLPSLFDEKMNVHQYVVQANQVRADKARRQFYDTDSYANTFGVEPNFGCCAANFHQGFPKFFDSAFYFSSTECIIAQLVAGSFVEKTKKGDISLELRGNFPYENTFSIKIADFPVDKKLKVRLPENYEYRLFYNGLEYSAETSIAERGKIQVEKYFLCLDTVSVGDEVRIEFRPQLKMVTNADRTASYYYGAFLLAHKIEAKEVYLKGKEPFYDRAYIPQDKFNVVPLLKEGKIQVEKIVQSSELGDVPFNRKNAHLELLVKGVEITNYRQRKNSAHDKLKKFVLGNEKMMRLVPFAETSLRISHFYKINI